VWGSIDIEIDQGIGFVWSELGNLLLRNDQVVCDPFFFTIKVSISQARSCGLWFSLESEV
jgi:hypothetical protein